MLELEEIEPGVFNILSPKPLIPKVLKFRDCGCSVALVVNCKDRHGPSRSSTRIRRDSKYMKADPGSVCEACSVCKCASGNNAPSPKQPARRTVKLHVSNLPNPKFKPLIQKPGKVDASSSTEYADKWKGTLSSSLRVPVLQGFTLQSCGSEF